MEKLGTICICEWRPRPSQVRFLKKARVGLPYRGFCTNFRIVIGKYHIVFDDAVNKVNKLKLWAYTFILYEMNYNFEHEHIKG